ncbi:MAG: toll/interleukin-1 receptor domain-containing protein [Anaerolineae bacterium]|nr:toll/interleukin-1 receptor domain-containing protein [Anaerolineae bacterium]
MNIFVSYSSHNRAAVKSLVADLTSLGHDVWFDQELTGGQVWWDTILGHIRACDIVIFAVSGKSITSGPCKLEYTYAYELGKPLLPVLLTGDVTITLLPVILQERQFVNYVNQDKAALLALNNAVQGILPAPALPVPLPDPPGIPISPLVALQAEIEKPALTHDEQVFLFHQLKGYADNPDFAHDALALMKLLEQHPSLLAAVFKEINTYLSAVSPERAVQPEPADAIPVELPPEPAPSGDTGQIRVRRPNELGAILRGFQVHIDGVHVGEVRNNQNVTYDVPPGPHTLHIQIDWIKSEDTSVIVSPGQVITLAAHWRAGILGGKLSLTREDG